MKPFSKDKKPYSLRQKLLILTMVPLLLTALSVVAMTAYWSSSYSDRQLYMRVSADLSVAQGTLEIMQAEQLNVLVQLAKSFEFQTNLLLDQQLALQTQLQETRINRSLDFLRLIPVNEITNPNRSLLSHDLMSILTGEPVTNLTVMSADELDAISYGLGTQVRITLIDTPRATPSSRKVEDRAMVIRSLYPIKDDFGELMGLLDGGLILNNTTKVVDSIRELVYGPGTLPEGGIGTVTIFLDDVRISTNVPVDITSPAKREMTLTERAIGTRVSEEVHDKVLIRGQKWVDRAFVVNAWYISAYQPLTDFFGNTIGMIYTGFNEAPFNLIYYKSLLEAGSVIGLIMLVSAAVLIGFARDLLHPLKQIHSVVRSVQEGTMDKRIGRLETDDELSDLAIQFDSMLDLLEQREAEVRQANDQLELKVQQRTEELKQHIELLQTTREKMVTQEKLAVLGELTAGIAHEINNPAAVILGNMDLLIQELGELIDPVKPEVELIIEQVYRIRSLINNLLQYSRPKIAGRGFDRQDINAVVTDTLLLVKHALDKQGATVASSLNASIPVEINPQQIQQVLVNLILNAAHAMAGKGVIRIHTKDWQKEDEKWGVVIEVIDEAGGIPEEHQKHIFDPFFTTRESGTGLGLPISRGIIQRHGGELTLESESGKGSTFAVYLPKTVPASIHEDDQVADILGGLSANRPKKVF